MEITRTESFAVTVSYEDAMRGTHAILRLHTDEGSEGIAYVSRVAPRNMAAILALMEQMGAAVVGRDPLDHQGVRELLAGSVLGAPVTGLELRVASAFDVACWDLKGKAAGQPLRRLMGGNRDRLPVSANWGLMPGRARDDLERHLRDLIGRGFQAVKCPVGFAALDDAIEHVRTVRAIVGPDVRIIVDLNFQHDVAGALRFARETEDCDLFWIEDPVPYHDIAGMAEVTRTAPADVTCGEVFQHTQQFRDLLSADACDNVMIDQDLGLTGFLEVAAMAAAAGKPVVNHLAPETLVHPLAAVPNGLIVGLVPWALPLFREQPVIEDGHWLLSDAPGLGLTFDEDVLRTSRVS